jgi:Secretion system C-terminal sorting domain
MKSFLPKGIWTILALCLFGLLRVNAQCPGTVTAAIAAQNNATCPSNASVTVGSNANSVATATYQALSAPAGVTLAPQSSNIFTSLPPGSYTFKVTCGASFATVNTVITSTYTQLTANTVLTNVCNSFTKGGTITVTAAGGTLPYIYSVRKTPDANYADGLSTYGTSNIFNVTDSGTYQVRVKDNCGNFITKTVIIKPGVPAIYLNPGSLYFNQACASGNATLYFYLTDVNGAGMSSSDFEYGFKVDMYKKGTGCTRTDFIATLNFPQYAGEEIIIPQNQDLYFKVTNSCGDTTSSCFVYADWSGDYTIHWEILQTGCASAQNPNGLVNLANNYSLYQTPDENFSVLKLDGTVVRVPTGDSAVFHNLPYGTYVVVGQDACGKISKDTLYPPAPGDAIEFYWWTGLECTNQTGTLTYYAFIGGFIYDAAHAVITITSGPGNVGVAGDYNGDLGYVIWHNMLPGNYTASIVTPCGAQTVSFTINAGETVLEQSMNITTQQACNNGGVITAQLTYNGDGDVTYTLYDALGTNIATNTSGVFIGLAAGTYTVKANVHVWNCTLTDYTVDKTAIILPDGTPPQVNKKIVMICEDGSGNPTANGKAIISSAGFAPFKAEVKLVTEPDAGYAVRFAATAGNFTVDNLTAYENYRIRITDQCGNTALTDVSVGILEQLAPVNNGVPCIGQSYTLSAPDMIDAVYTWRKGGIVVAASREIIFPAYTATNDGTYTCTIEIGGGCVTRLVTQTINGILCSTLPIKIENFSAAAANCNAVLNWTINSTGGTTGVAVQKSNNGSDFITIKNLSVTVAGAFTQHFTDVNADASVNYYRLIIKDNDGRQTVSAVVTVKNNCYLSKNQLTVYPNPVLKNKDVVVSIISLFAGITEVKLLNGAGQVLDKRSFNAKVGANNTTLNTGNLPAGIYIMFAALPNGEILQQKIMKL